MTGKLNLDPQTIVDKEFDIDFKGYNPDQVDHMLDQIILDYQTYDNTIKELNAKIEDLDRTNASLRAKVMDYESKERANKADGNTGVFAGNNIDILKRLSRLEEQVFDGSKKD